MKRYLILLSPRNVLPWIPLVGLVSLFFYFQIEPRDRIPETVNLASVSRDWEIYFSRPDEAQALSYRGGPDSALVDSLDSAQYSIDMAIYHLDLWSVRDALLRAHRRGVPVRLVVESNNANEIEIRSLKDAGIEVHEDHRPHLMHHKFVIIDRIEIWTGSMNLTLAGAYENENNLIHMVSRDLAQNYLVEFEEMFTEGRFGGLSRMDTPHQVTSIGGMKVETYFSPDDRVLQALLTELHQAEGEVIFLAFTMTSDPIRDALIELRQRGINVRGVADGSQSEAVGSDLSDLLEAGIDLRLTRSGGLMHHKVMVIDKRVVVLGSYNFTRSAEERNDENVLIIHDPDLASIMLLEFDRIYEMRP
jgi:phosphatidylserine/phosphatidylglycerophosphate/cardiolipin synthase-like enzyme